MTQTVILECSNGKKLKKTHSDCSSAIMGKTQKFSKGYSSGFIPDYRHAAETVGETEGFANSCRVDSEVSCTPKRKSMSINVDQRNSFNVPVQVISASNMSDTEKKDLLMRLRGELEKVRILHKKILSRTSAVSSGVALSSSGDGYAKKQGLSRGMSGRVEIKRQAPSLPGNFVSMLMKQCETLLKNLMTHRYGWVFNTPVDVVKLKIPDYFNIIKHPMDLGSVKKKLTSGSYSSLWAFASDVRLTFTNAMTYNPPGNDVHIMADALKNIFEKKWRPIGEKLASVEEIIKRDKQATKSESQSLPKKRKPPPLDFEAPISKNLKPMMPFSEKQELKNRLESAEEDLPEHIVNFLKQQTYNAKTTEDDEIEIDIESLSDDTLFKLRKLVDEYFGAKQTVPQEKAEPCEMEILAEPGVSNSSIHPYQVSEPADEDVDIGGDDLPISSYPPVEIQKDTAPRSSKCSTSSSSCSDSGSSSSDSDSGSSSRGSESDAKAASPNSIKEHEQPGVAVGTEKCDTAVSFDANRTISGMDQQDHSAHLEPTSVEADDYREGENATSKRQVSPDKLYRAALLRNRFADTILKAREKTLNQGLKKDPEKLRREREELERQQREEKARLQAEAKAAEEARRQAEAEAAAEAKRKRELEREAARQALLQIERTVEINENSLFMKDLEVLGTGPAENISSTVHEMSPDPLQGLGCFNVGGSNPLEQLGLFRKDDDDEEEEECGPTSPPQDDIEEGEID
ncbi:uncharacterized protein A4U43_C04F5160 [Asparagus officinalis]|uniref:Bromo domain-containing protein n=1 Tax=Asparagus officinalis TaxID=4686 RepID=A0A5P1EZ31_ASPOF|nr:transcription factor GTE9-like [Asparagus officinalis]ONK71144.1 uncharacterized protein A4U43_C04F5160 [Asparagus officinalis]